MFIFLSGVLVGVFLVLTAAYVYFLYPIKGLRRPLLFADQFPPLRIPQVLARFLRSNEDGSGGSKWESCFTLSIIAHFLFQEFKDTRQFRRWFYKRLQLELNDLTTRSAAGLLIQDVRVRELSLGSEFPVVSNVRIESYQMSEDGHGFEVLNLLVDVDYTGGFQTSVDAALVLNRHARLSLKVTHLAGKVRLSLSRRPYTHWSFAFVETPVLDFKVESEWQGRQVKHVIPLITQQFRRLLQRKHVFPNYKIRYRPFFPNPLFTPSPPMEAFAHVKVEGGLEVTVLQCTRLNVSLASEDHTEVYCTLSIDQRPFLHSSSPHSIHCFTVLINFIRHGHSEPLGLTFNKSVAELGLRAVQISYVVPGSTAEKCGFKTGDIVLAVNNVPIRNERQASKLLCGTAGELNVLVERSLADAYETQHGLLFSEDVVVKGDIDDDGFLLVGENKQEAIAVESVVDDEKIVEPTILLVQRKRSNSASTVERASGAGIEAHVRGDLCLPAEDVKELCSSMPPSVFLAEKPISVETKLEDKQRLGAGGPCSEFRKTRSNTEIASSFQKTVDDLYDSVTVTRRDTSVSDVLPRSFKANDYVGPAIQQEYGVSITSLPSSISAVGISSQLHHTVGSVNEAEETVDTISQTSAKESEKSTSRRQRIKSRAAEMAAAGKAKVSDFWYKRRENNAPQCTSEVVFGEALHEPVQLYSTSERKKKIGHDDHNKKTVDDILRQRRQSEHSIGSNKTDADSNSVSEKPMPHSRCTRRLQLTENVLWGQSLHFSLEEERSRYLNITVHSGSKLDGQALTGERESASEEISKPSLLGYASVYIPQVIDDCQLTLSNCHREMFTMRPPPDPIPKRPKKSAVEEASRHAGFDARLCYGDVLLSFRYFPSGLPREAGLNPDVDHMSDEEATSSNGVTVDGTHSQVDLPSTPTDVSSVARHNFQTITLKTAASCAICNGKVWLKTASRCSNCYMICHNKCVSKGPAQASVCTPNKQFDDVGFEILDSAVPVTEPGFLDDAVGNDNTVSQLATTVSVIPFSSAHSEVKERNSTRRRRIAEKVSEKLSSTWSRMGHKNISTSNGSKSSMREKEKEVVNSEAARDVVLVEVNQYYPLASIIPDVFSQLHISGKLSEMKYEPGNAYNEQMINAAKTTGKDIFYEFEPEERKEKINTQIGEIKAIIDKTTAERMKIIKQSSGHAGEGNPEFTALDDRLQALAVLMLHYCSALQNCNEQEDERETAAGSGSQNTDLPEKSD